MTCSLTLLDAAKLALKWMGEPNRPTWVCEAIRDTIAKAECPERATFGPSGPERAEMSRTGSDNPQPIAPPRPDNPEVIRPAADAMEAALRALKAAAPFFAIANAVTDVGDPDYREWFAEAGDHCVAFCFAGSVITLGDLRAAARAQYPERDIPAPAASEAPENAPSGKARPSPPMTGGRGAEPPCSSGSTGDEMTPSHLRDEQMEDLNIRETMVAPQFGDIITNGWASENNPTRVGYFVREGRRTGRLNPGPYFEVTDGNGKFWELPLDRDHKITVRPAALLSSAEAREEAGGREWFWRIVDAGGLADLPSDEEAALRLLVARRQAAETRAQQAEAFVRLVGRLTMTGDDGWTPPDDPDDVQAALDRLIALARDLMAAMPARQSLGASHG